MFVFIIVLINAGTAEARVAPYNPGVSNCTVNTALSIGSGGAGATSTSTLLQALLPLMSGNSGKYLRVNDSALEWTTLTTGSGAWGSIGGALTDQSDECTIL